MNREPCPLCELVHDGDRLTDCLKAHGLTAGDLLAQTFDARVKPPRTVYAGEKCDGCGAIHGTSSFECPPALVIPFDVPVTGVVPNAAGEILGVPNVGTGRPEPTASELAWVEHDARLWRAAQGRL